MPCRRTRRRSAAPASVRSRATSSAAAGRRSSAATTSSSSPGPAAATATTTRRSWSTRRSASSSASARPRSPRRASLPSQRDDCLFCRLYSEGEHVAKAKGFVAINDINPQAEVHLLVIPERHVETFRDVGDFPAHDAKRMLEFVADAARGAGLTDYQVQVNVGPTAGQTVFHLHWHVLGRPERHQGEVATTAVSEL